MLLLAFVLSVVVGCDRGENTRPTATEPADTSASSADVQEADESKGQGDACQRDHDCQTYLRCYDEQCIEPPAMTGQRRPETPVVQFLVDGEQVAAFKVELAVTSPEKQRGLMYRKSMKDDWGMLFIYDGDAPRSFWMKNTFIPLDMVFIDSAGEVVGIVEDAEPLTLEPRSVDEPARYVLELNTGVAAQSGIVKGARMRIENAPQRFKPSPRNSGDSDADPSSAKAE